MILPIVRNILKTSLCDMKPIEPYSTSVPYSNTVNHNGRELMSIKKIVYVHKEFAEKMHKIRSEVDSNISKFYNGTTPWPPQIQTHRDRIDYWHSIIRIKTGVFTSKNAIKKLSIKLGEYSGQCLSAAEALKNWKEPGRNTGLPRR